MKTQSLLFSLPLLVSVLAAQAVPPKESIADGTIDIRGLTLLAGPGALDNETAIPKAVAALNRTEVKVTSPSSTALADALTSWGTTKSFDPTKASSSSAPNSRSVMPVETAPTVDEALTGMSHVSLAPCETRVLGIRGRRMAMDILTDRMHVRPQHGRGFEKHLPGVKSVSDADREATVYDLRGVDRADLIAYPHGRDRKEANKILLTRRICVKLAEGVAFSKFATKSGAVIAERPFYAEEAIILSYVTTEDALEAVDRLAALPGVLGAHVIIAQQHIPEFLPPVQYFSGGGPPYAPLPLLDNVDGWQPLPYLAGILGTSAYQWWANNVATIQVPPPLFPIPTEPFGWFTPTAGPRLLGSPPAPNPSRVDLGDFPPINYDNAATPKFAGEMCDLRLPLAWENLGDFDRPISGNMRKVLIIDDGIQKAHPDLFLAVDLNTQRHWNYTNNQASAEPLNNTDTHGTSMAGIVGARIKTTGSRVAGVAPNCIFHGVVALKGFVDDFEWSDAFAFSAPPPSGPPQTGGGPPEGNNRGTIKDTDRDNEWLDETRSGIVFFEIALNAQSNLGSQDAANLYAESWLWKRAIRFSATRGNALKGVSFVTSSGNGAEGHMDCNYMELKNSIYQIPVGGISDHGRRIAYSVGGAPLVCVAPTWGQELPPYLNWPNAPPGWPANRPFQKNAPIGPDDVLPWSPVNQPFFYWRRLTQGITSITNTAVNNGIDFNLAGTSTSAAMVAGVVALMLEANPALQARDVKEILLRSSRVCGDIRVDRGASRSPNDDDIIKDDTVAVKIGRTTPVDRSQTYQLKTGQLWRMAPMGHPIHPFFGAGLVDADKAVKIAKKWKPLPVNPLPPIQRDVLKDSFGSMISDRNTETGGLYFPIATTQLIPTNGTPLEIMIPGPPAGMRVEHIEIRVRAYHKRRGDLEITLVAPGAAGWEKGRELESELFVPHREDYNEDRYSAITPELRDPMDWTFTTVRHWGTIVQANAGGVWRVRVRDTVTQGRTEYADVNYTDTTYVPTDNPTDAQSQRIDGVGVTYHGTFGKAISNSAPEVVTGNLRFDPSSAPETAQLGVAELGRNPQTGEVIFPVTSWDFWSNTVRRVDGQVVPNYTPVQPTAPPVDFFEFFPPQARDAVDPTIHVPISVLGLQWPLQPDSPMWVSFVLDPAARPATWPPPPTSGAVGALTQRPRWVEMTPDELWMIVRDVNNTNAATNFVHVRLNRANGKLDVIPFNKGKYLINVYAESLLGLSKPKEIEINVSAPGYQAWADLFWDVPDLSDPAWQGPVSGWLADPDADGLVNGLEYALRLNPLINDPGPIPAYRIEGDEVVFSWTKDQTAIDAFLIPQVSEDLESWGDVSADVVSVGGANGMTDYEYRLPLAGEPRIFFRLWSDYNKNAGLP